MQVETMKKTCSNILYIKSIVMIVLTIIGFVCGFSCILIGNSLKDQANNNPANNLGEASANCSMAFIGALGVVIGIISMIVSIILAFLAIASFVNARRMKRSELLDFRQFKGAMICEVLYLIIAGFGIVLTCLNFKELIVAFIILVIFFLIDLSTIIMLIMLNKKIQNKE